MKLTPITLTTLEVTGIQGLDPIRLYLQDLGTGMGRLTFECYGLAYSAFWNAMGPQTVREFVTSIDLGYFMTRCGVKERQQKHPYTRRLFTAVQEACKAQPPSTQDDFTRGMLCAAAQLAKQESPTSTHVRMLLSMAGGETAARQHADPEDLETLFPHPPTGN